MPACFQLFGCKSGPIGKQISTARRRRTEHGDYPRKRSLDDSGHVQRFGSMSDRVDANIVPPPEQTGLSLPGRRRAILQSRLLVLPLTESRVTTVKHRRNSPTPDGADESDRQSDIRGRSR